MIIYAKYKMQYTATLFLLVCMEYERITHMYNNIDAVNII